MTTITAKIDDTDKANEFHKLLTDGLIKFTTDNLPFESLDIILGLQNFVAMTCHSLAIGNTEHALEILKIVHDSAKSSIEMNAKKLH